MMLGVKNLDAYYGEGRIVENLSLSVEKGKIVTLIGRNGVGKSTTLKSLMGLVKNPKGSILFDGAEMARLPAYSRAKLGIGYVPQGRDIFPQLTVAENLELGLRALGRRPVLPDYIFELFPVLPKFAKRRGGDLSGGQQQQLAIARALAPEPKILILDEPTEGIQPSVIEDIGAAVRRINKWKGVTVLMVEQYLDFALGISDYIYVMEKGKIVHEGKASDIDAKNVQSIMTD
jgi:urea transport system ATP-binding protein